MSVFKMPVDNPKLTSKYSASRLHPVKGKVQKHAGIDLVNTKVAKCPVYATADGVVRLVKETKDGYGKYIIVTHNIDNTKYESVYAHLDDFKCKVGQVVKQGDTIGIMGDTGLGKGIHLHFEIHRGTYSYDGGNYPTALDPLPLIQGVEEMQLSKNGLEFIKKHEGHYLYWYELQDGGLTTGYGHYVPHSEAKKLGIKKGDVITQKQADDYLRADMKKFEVGTDKMIKEYGFNLNQNQFDALVSYAFNRGLGNSAGTNGLRQLLKNSKNLTQLANNIVVYWGTNETYKNGLLKRRKAEQALFLSTSSSKPIEKKFEEMEVNELKTSNSTMQDRLMMRYGSSNTHAMIDDAAIKLVGDSKTKLVNGKMSDGDFVANAAEVAVAAIKKLKEHKLY